jgi:hypothetical protein
MKNIIDLTDDELAELGKHTQQALIKLMFAYDTNNKQDTTINRELFTFEFADKGKRDWIQATIGIITEPVLFHEDNAHIHSWISTKVHYKIAEQMNDCLLQMIDVLEESNIPYEYGKELIRIVENKFTSIAEQLNNRKEIL